MSPASVTEQARQDQHVEILARGFDALLETARNLALKEKVLQSKLKFAHDEVRILEFFFFLLTTACDPPPHMMKHLISSRSGVAFATVTD